ncbi:MAG: hypothetical protein ABIL40_05790 [candidate division WOR-3 bacterium]
MKRLILLTLATIPLFAFSVNFIYCDYDEDEAYWCDEYWGPDPYWCDGYWVYYPHGYYCVYYVWYHPWWWDWYWWRCHWCHHFDWHFFCAGFYIVWYEDGHWWWRPRYGRWVRYKLPYGYAEFRARAKAYGVDLPEKPPRTIELPYKEKEILRLTKEKDPQLYARIEKEYKSGNLERMRKAYETKVRTEIAQKNEEYRKIRMQKDFEPEGRSDKNSPERIIRKRNEVSPYQPESETDQPKIFRKSPPPSLSPEYEDYHRPEDTHRPIRNLPPFNPDKEKRNERKNKVEKIRR